MENLLGYILFLIGSGLVLLFFPIKGYVKFTTFQYPGYAVFIAQMHQIFGV